MNGSDTDPVSDAPAGATRRVPPQGHRLGAALLVLPALVLRSRARGREPDLGSKDGLPPSLPVDPQFISAPTGRVAFYASVSQQANATPLLLAHSINAAASAFEVRPIFERAADNRTVYALDLPGFGSSDRPNLAYTPRLMTDTILMLAEEIARRHGGGPIDALGLSLSSEFLARAAVERPDLFRSLALISPTGFDSRGPRLGPPGSVRAKPGLYKGLTFGLWRRSLFRLLTSRVSLRYFLEKTFGSSRVDENLLAFDYLTSHQPGAEHAPLRFVGGYLFSGDSTRIYDALRVPVLLLHGTRGDFVDYAGTARVVGRTNWTVEVLQTGALPHFEEPDRFWATYKAFLDRSPRP